MLLKSIVGGTATFGSTMLYRRVPLSLCMPEVEMSQVYGNCLTKIRLHRGTVAMMAGHRFT